MSHWLVKSEPETYSIDDLQRDGRTVWEGVRNHQAKNFMRDGMRPGDLVLFHHSSAKPPAIVGVARVVRSPIPDLTALDPKSPYHDPRATEDEPIWMMAELEFVERFAEPVPLSRLRDEPRLEGMALLQRGQRLSVQPVSKAHFTIVCGMGRSPSTVASRTRKSAAPPTGQPAAKSAKNSAVKPVRKSAGSRR